MAKIRNTKLIRALTGDKTNEREQTKTKIHTYKYQTVGMTQSFCDQDPLLLLSAIRPPLDPSSRPAMTS